MKLLGLLICMLVFPLFGSAQIGFLGKRFTASAGLEYSPFNIDGMVDVSGVSSDKIVSIRPVAEIGIVLNNRIQLMGNASYHLLANSSYHESEDISKNYTYWQDYSALQIDRVYMESRFLQFGADCRMFFDYAPIGTYLDFGLGVNLYSASIQHSRDKIATHNELDIESIISDIYPVEHKSFMYNYLSVGWGECFMLTRNLILDYGIRTVLDMGFRREFEFREDKEYKESRIEQIAKSISKSNNLINVYVKIGFCK